MYRCEPCKAVCRGTLKRHVLRRADGSTSREVPVCSTCQGHLDAGMNLAFLIRHIAKQETGRESVIIEVVVPPVEALAVTSAPVPIAINATPQPTFFEFRKVQLVLGGVKVVKKQKAKR